MKTTPTAITYLIFLVLSLSLGTAAFGQKKQTKSSKGSASLRVMSYNIRTANGKDSSNVWEFRKDKMGSQINYHRPDLLGVQEALQVQLKDLEERLPAYAWYGVGRQEGNRSNEYSAIFYRKDRFKLLDSGTFWFSETPQVPASKSWDSAFPRICSWVKLQDLQTGKTFFHFNTHFDHRGTVARQKSAEILVQQTKTLAGKLPVLLTGDFNITSIEEPYKILTQNSGLQDAQFKSITPPFGPAGTSINFYVKDPIRGKIDFIFVNDAVKVLQHAVLSDQMDGRYLSDHLAVVAEVELQ